jgi:hypothetical protein
LTVLNANIKDGFFIPSRFPESCNWPITLIGRKTSAKVSQDPHQIWSHPLGGKMILSNEIDITKA